MRYLIILITAITLFPQTLSAQNDIVVNEILEYMSLGEKTGFEVAILDADPDEVESNFKKHLKRQKAKVKTSRKSVELFADNAMIPEVSANTVDIYAIAGPASYGTSLKVFVDLGGAFISSSDHEIEFGAFVNFLKEFALEEATRIVEEELNEQEDILKGLSKELDGLIKDSSKYMKEIEKAKKVIEQREADVETAIKNQETLRAKIAIQEEIVQTIKSKKITLGQ